MRMTVFIWLLAFPLSVIAKKQGRPLIDSLSAALSVSDEDSNKAKLLAALSDSYSLFSPDSGILYGEKALSLADRLGWKTGIATANYFLGFNYYDKSLYPEALQCLFKSLAVSEAIGNENLIANASRKIGNIYRDRKNYTKALEYYFKALKIFERNRDTFGIARCFSNLAEIYGFEHRFTGAMGYHTKALKFQEEIGYKNGLVITYMRMGILYNDNGKYAEALINHLKALQIARENKDVIPVEQIQETLGNIGQCYLNIARHSARRDTALRKSIDYLSEAIAIAGTMGHLTDLGAYYSYLAEANELSGNYRKAYQALHHSYLLKDSVFSASNNGQIALAETKREKLLKERIERLERIRKRNETLVVAGGFAALLFIAFISFRSYKVQKKSNRLLAAEKRKVEAQTEVLTATLDDLRQAQDQLIKAEKQKENAVIRSRISQDIHDDISSELTRISWVSELAKANALKGDIREVPALLDKVTSTSRETVHKLGEIIWAINPRYDNLDSLLSYMRNHISKFLEDTPVACTISFPGQPADIPVNPEFKRHLFLVMKEALNNALKYSGASQIDVRFECTDLRYTLSITDNGRGFTEPAILGGGNGLPNMRRRMEYINGSLLIVSGAGQGTTITCSGTIY